VTPDLRDRITPGSLAPNHHAVMSVRVLGGYNVHERDRDGVLVWECLHLHPTRGQARTCAEARRGN